MEIRDAGNRMSDWQLIETAPKDGSAILLWTSRIERNYTVQGLCDNHAIGFWEHGRWQSIEVQDCGTMGSELTGWMEDWCPIDVQPTHWMPLPDAPC